MRLAAGASAGLEGPAWEAVANLAPAEAARDRGTGEAVAAPQRPAPAAPQPAPRPAPQAAPQAEARMEVQPVDDDVLDIPAFLRRQAN